MKSIAILGSTGSIGKSTMQVVRKLKEKIRITALAAGSNIDLLEEQAKEFRPQLIAVYDSKKALELRKRLPDVEVLGGMEGVIAVAEHQPAQLVVSAMVGTLGLIPTVAALRKGKDVGLANKEALVSGGALVTRLAQENNAKLLPIDSEHSAIFQCLNGENSKNIRRILLTSSGGPFRTWTEEQLKGITVEQALNHPTWNMGPKITIDSSTLMNKGLEVIEAHWLFDTPLEKIEVVIHPQSIIHSMVEFVDGSMKAQLSVPTMIVPIQYALTYPDRAPGLLEPFDFIKNNRLDFYAPDFKRFPCLSLAFESVRQGGTLPCFMNAANEVLVNRFLKKEFAWGEIANRLEQLMASHQVQAVGSIEDVLQIDRLAREQAAVV